MEDVEQINMRLTEIEDRLFSTKKQALDLIGNILTKYEVEYDFSDVDAGEDELFYNIQTADGIPAYFHIVFDVDSKTGFVAAYAQIVDEEELDELLATEDMPEVEIQPVEDYWTTTPYLRQTRRTEDDGGD